MEELPAGVRAAMAMANGNRPTMTAEVVAVEEVHEKTVFIVKVSTAPMVAKAEIEQILQALATKKFPVSPELIGLATALRDDPNFAGLVGFVQNLVVAAGQSQ